MCLTTLLYGTDQNLQLKTADKWETNVNTTKQERFEWAKILAQERMYGGCKGQYIDHCG